MKILLLLLSTIFICCESRVTIKNNDLIASSKIDSVPSVKAKLNSFVAISPDSFVIKTKIFANTIHANLPIYDNRVGNIAKLFGEWKVAEIGITDVEADNISPGESMYSEKDAYLLISKDSFINNNEEKSCSQTNPQYEILTRDDLYYKTGIVYRAGYKANRKYLQFLIIEGCDEFEIIDKDELLYKNNFIYRRVSK